MFFKAILFALLCHQSICYSQQLLCSELTFGKCSIRSYCGIADTGLRTCLPCPVGKLCPGDGYTYPALQLNAKHNILSSVSPSPSSGNGVYIVSERKLFKKFKYKSNCVLNYL